MQYDYSGAEVTRAVKLQAMDILEGSSLVFIPNCGQAHPKVSYYTENRGRKIFFTPEEVVIAEADLDEEEQGARGFALYLRFAGASPTPPEGRIPGIAKVNYFFGSDSDRWRTGLPTCEEIVYRNLWPEIDLVFRGQGRELKYEFIAYPGADINNISLDFSGVDDLVLDKNGDILISTPFGILTDKKPVSFQLIDGNKVPLASNFVVTKSESGENRCGFRVSDNYSPDYTLVIDPSLGFPPFPKREGIDSGLGIAIDNAGNAYVTGFTDSPDFPVTSGAFQAERKGSMNAFVSVINTGATGAAALVYSTYLGGCVLDVGFGIAVDNNGLIYVTGATESSDFPVTSGAFQGKLNGFKNAFVSVLNPNATGTAVLVYSTYLGGCVLDVGFGIAVDNSGNAYLTGFTESPDFPVTAGAFQGRLNGIKNAFLSVLNTGATGGTPALAYSTYLGGSSFDEGYGIAVDASGAAYITGFTYSKDFPVTSGAFQAALNSKHGGANAFVSKFRVPSGRSATGTPALAYSTYLGGSLFDQGYGIAVDASNNAYVTGFTRSIDFPVTSGAFQTALNSILGGTNAFVTKLNTGANGARSLVYSTYLGGTTCDEGHGIAVDTAGNAYVTGFTYSKDFPVTASAFQSTLKSIHSGGSNAFVSQINTSRSGNSSLAYSTYLGGSGSDVGNGIAVDRFGDAYVTGRTESHDFPVTSGAYQPKLSGHINAFVSEINTSAAGTASLVYSTYLGR
jgi:hypothetical protein